MSFLMKSIFINAPLDKVAEYAMNPNEWSHWYIHLSGPDKLTGQGEAGTVGEYRYSLLGIHLPVTIEVKEFLKSPNSCVWKGTFTGSLEGTQTFTYVAKDSGTEVTAEIDYTVPGKILGKITNTALVERIQENATVGTLENLKAMCEAS